MIQRREEVRQQFTDLERSLESLSLSHSSHSLETKDHRKKQKAWESL